MQGQVGSLFPPDHLFEVDLTLCCYNRQLVLQVVRDKVAYALKQHVFGSDLYGGQQKRGDVSHCVHYMQHKPSVNPVCCIKQWQCL